MIEPPQILMIVEYTKTKISAYIIQHAVVSSEESHEGPVAVVSHGEACRCVVVTVNKARDAWFPLGRISHKSTLTQAALAALKNKRSSS